MSSTGRWLAVTSCGCCGEGRSHPAGRVAGIALRRCAACGTMRFDAVASPEGVYRDGYHTGDLDFGWDYAGSNDGVYERVVAEARLDWLERSLRPGRLVDVGGGLGFFTAAAAARGWEVVLLEPVASAVEEARERFGLDAVLGGAEDLPGLGRTFDVVAFVHCIEHIPAAREVLDAAAAALPPGGHVFVEVPNHGSLSRRTLGDRWHGWQPGEHVYVFDRRTLRGLVERAGYEVVAERTFVPGWRGLVPDAYGHFLGLTPLVRRVVTAKRRLLDSPQGSSDEGGGADPTPVAIDASRGWRRLVYGVGFDALARVEEAAGLGSNLQLLARRR